MHFLPVVDCGGDAFRPAGAAVRGDDSNAMSEGLVLYWKSWPVKTPYGESGGDFMPSLGHSSCQLPIAYCRSDAIISLKISERWYLGLSPSEVHVVYGSFLLTKTSTFLLILFVV